MYNIVILDAGHGSNTPGKRSPKWPSMPQLFEHEFNRNVVSRIAAILKMSGIQCHVLVPELTDISLGERVRRANKVYDQYKGKAFLVSVHANAGGGTGWEIWTSRGRTKSDDIASEIFKQAKAEFPEFKMRSDTSDGDPDKEADFYILKNTKCPAVLTENFFMDTVSDCKLLLSEQGRERIACFHAKAIANIMKWP